MYHLFAFELLNQKYKTWKICPDWALYVKHLFEGTLFRFDSHSYFLGSCKQAKASFSSSCPPPASFLSKLVWGLIALSGEVAELSTVTNMLNGRIQTVLPWLMLPVQLEAFCVTLCLNNSMVHFSTRILCKKMVNRKDVISHLFCLHCQGLVVHHNSV